MFRNRPNIFKNTPEIFRNRPETICALLPVLTILLFINGCDQRTGEYYTIQGFAQGTTYRITWQHPPDLHLQDPAVPTGQDLRVQDLRVQDLRVQDPAVPTGQDPTGQDPTGQSLINLDPAGLPPVEYLMQDRIDSLLDAYNQSLSTYERRSVISMINRNESMETDSLFRDVYREAERVYELSGGAFDITVGPLIDAWGFGPGEKQEVDSALVDSLLQYVGMDKVRLVGNRIRKEVPGIRLDVNAIAQGHSVDVVSQYLAALGCEHYMVEIGGEVRTRGRNPRGVFWRIGIDRPAYGNMIPGEQLQVIISMRNRSLATSGNYRKYYETESGLRITHSIDPKTGYPKQSKLLSVTILTDRCITADAYATTCMVLGLEGAISFIEGLEDTDAYLIYGDELGTYQVWHTPGLTKYIETP